jgi:hypothetical protein
MLEQSYCSSAALQQGGATFTRHVWQHGCPFYFQEYCHPSVEIEDMGPADKSQVSFLG